MAPTQLSGEIKQTGVHHLTTKVASGKGIRTLFANSGGKGLRTTSNFEDTIMEMEAILDEHTKAPDVADNVEVDVIDYKGASDVRIAETVDPDATDYSSSFGSTVSGTENCSGLSDLEVESRFCGDGALEFDGFGSLFPIVRKKKLTSHWRSFIWPLMWRCKWTELKIKEFESQAAKHARELAAYDQRKQLELNQFSLEGFNSKSLPFTSQNRRVKAMKRRKRKRVEDTTDVQSYMSHHNLFSYRENKGSDPECTSMADDFGNPVFTEQNTSGLDEFGISDDGTFLESKDSDKYLEQILQKIETVYSRVHKMKAQLDTVMSKNTKMFSSCENLSILAPCDLPTFSAPSPTFSACNFDTLPYTPSQHISEYDIGDLVMPETAVSSYGEVIHLPDIIESTVGLLSSADVTLHQPQSADSSEDMMDDILLIHNQAAAEVEGQTTCNVPTEKHEGQTTCNVPSEKHEGQTACNVPTEKHEEQQQEKSGLVENIIIPSPSPSLEPPPNVVAKSVVPQEQQSSMKSSSCLAPEIRFPKNKRKRGERKAGAGIWSQKCSGEGDNSQ